MTPFVEIKRNAAASMADRLFLLQKPLEFFRPYCGGQTPTLSEKLFCVERAVQELAPLRTCQNDLYEVQVFSRPPLIHLNISRRDGQPCKDDRHFQQIKNELVGHEFEAIELFPAQSRLVDAGNQYHLWVHASPGFRFPVAFEQNAIVSRLVELAERMRSPETLASPGNTSARGA